jgi:phosphopantetheinyl transferase (holo-ACP synthase)
MLELKDVSYRVDDENGVKEILHNVNLKIDNKKKQNLKIDVSLSHIKDYAVATAVAIYEE